MKIVFLGFYLCVFLGANNFLYAEEITRGDALYQEITVETMHPYFEALKNGDVELIKSSLSGEMAEKYKVLLEKNEDYPEFLRNHFRDADFSVGKIEQNGNDLSVDIIVKFPGNQPSKSKFLFRKEMDDLSSGVEGRRWKKVKELKK